MSTCACPASSLTSVSFAHGVVMQRCGSHELQTWTVNGRRTDGRAVRGLLKDLFVETRGQRRPAAELPTHQVARSGARTHVAPDATTDERLTALLNARGVQGSWAIA